MFHLRRPTLYSLLPFLIVVAASFVFSYHYRTTLIALPLWLLPCWLAHLIRSYARLFFVCVAIDVALATLGAIAMRIVPHSSYWEIYTYEATCASILPALRFPILATYWDSVIWSAFTGPLYGLVGVFYAWTCRNPVGT